MTLEEFTHKYLEAVEAFSDYWKQAQSEGGSEVYPHDMREADWVEQLDTFIDEEF